MIDDSPAADEFKRVQRGKLDALLALAEAHDCRRVRLLAYFGETYRGPVEPGDPNPEDRPPQLKCGNCDNCLQPPEVWNATEAARKLLSCIYRCHQASGFGFGGGHLIDVLRGKRTDKVEQRGHDTLSTFGIGAELSESQWRGVLRQLIALGHVRSEGEYNTLSLADSARAVLRGEIEIQQRVPRVTPKTKGRSGARGAGREKPPPLPLDDAATERFNALKAWRAEVARAHNLPAYVVFHDATLAEMAREAPADLDALGGISGVGQKKLDAYGAQILEVLQTPA
jgi:ATP-dependent DNA helicase RecQ